MRWNTALFVGEFSCLGRRATVGMALEIRSNRPLPALHIRFPALVSSDRTTSPREARNFPVTDLAGRADLAIARRRPATCRNGDFDFNLGGNPPCTR